MGRIASFHLIDEPAWKTPVVLARLGIDRLRLRNVDGLVFWRLLGTGSGSNTGRGADLSRSALFAVWDDEVHLDSVPRRQQRRSSVAARRAELAHRGCVRSADTAPGKGSTRSTACSRAARTAPLRSSRAADVRRRSWRAFGKASEVVDVELHTAPGLIDVVGIGETPVGSLATFSLWESLAAARVIRVHDAATP